MARDSAAIVGQRLHPDGVTFPLVRLNCFISTFLHLVSLEIDDLVLLDWTALACLLGFTACIDPTSFAE
jgi:hypothetical protein